MKWNIAFSTLYAALSVYHSKPEHPWIAAGFCCCACVYAWRAGREHVRNEVRGIIDSAKRERS